MVKNEYQNESNDATEDDLIVTFNPSIGIDGNIPNTNLTVKDSLLTIHKSYLSCCEGILDKDWLHGISHITGGGLIDNIPRAIPDDLSVVINKDTWNMPKIFNWLGEQGKIDPHEMYKTFNCGVGLVLCVGENNADEIISYLNNNGETSWLIVEVVKNEKQPRVQLK